MYYCFHKLGIMFGSLFPNIMSFVTAISAIWLVLWLTWWLSSSRNNMTDCGNWGTWCMRLMRVQRLLYSSQISWFIFLHQSYIYLDSMNRWSVYEEKANPSSRDLYFSIKSVIFRRMLYESCCRNPTAIMAEILTIFSSSQQQWYMNI